MLNRPSQLIIALLVLVAMSCTSSTGNGEAESGFPNLSGPFLGQSLPDTLPRLFAPGVVSTGMFTRDMAITPDGKEIYFCVAIGNYTYSTILWTREVEGGWTPPEIVPFSGGPGVLDFEPALSPDGTRLYFLSTRPNGDEPVGDQDIWYVDRSGTGWSQPVNLGAPVNTDGGEFFPSLTHDGTLYFTRNEKGSNLNQIFRSRNVNGAFQEPELLPKQVNCGSNRFNAYVSPDESFVIIPAAGMEDTYDGVDYYIVFRDMSDNWSDPINMGPEINADNARGWSPYVSPDGKYFFFMAARTVETEPEHWDYEHLVELYNSPGNGNSDIYWMSAGFIRILKEKALIDP
jgi:Tol biopolymer transport system component